MVASDKVPSFVVLIGRWGRIQTLAPPSCTGWRCLKGIMSGGGVEEPEEDEGIGVDVIRPASGGESWTVGCIIFLRMGLLAGMWAETGWRTSFFPGPFRLRYHASACFSSHIF